MMKKNELVRQMGNARFLIARSSSTLEGYRTSLKLMNLGKELGFEEKKFTRVVVDNIGTKRWYLGNKLHWMGRPLNIQMEISSGVSRGRNIGWMVKGELHRVDGPAVEWVDGNKIWFFKGELHRVDGPAVIRPNKREEWWRDGIFIKYS